MSCRPWWIVGIALALVVGLATGYVFAPFSSLTASSPVTTFVTEYAAAAPAACNKPCCAAACCAKETPTEQPKQYVHFLIKDVEVKTSDATFTLGKVSFMYKGDGIEADVAKTALGGGDPTKLTKVVELAELASLLERLLATKSTPACCAAEPTPDCPAAPVCSPCYSPCGATETLPCPQRCDAAAGTCCPVTAPAPAAYAPPACVTGFPCGEAVQSCDAAHEAEEQYPEQLEEEPEELPMPTETPEDPPLDG